MLDYLKPKYVWWRKLLCVLGIHRLSNDWGVKWSNGNAITTCEYCDTIISNNNHWAIIWDWLRSKFRAELKYETSAFYGWLTPRWHKVFLLDYLGDVVRIERVKDGIDLVEFAKALKQSSTVEVQTKGWFGRSRWVEADSLKVALLLATKK